jgi:hypothetical protein
MDLLGPPQGEGHGTAKVHIGSARPTITNFSELGFSEVHRRPISGSTADEVLIETVRKEDLEGVAR